MFSPLQLNQMAQEDYHHALRKASQKRLVAIVRRRDNRLLSLESVMNRLHMRGQRSIGLVTVCIDQIVGTAGRTRDFDRSFLPLRQVTKNRWMNIIKAMYRGEYLPPIELHKIGDAYFVIDGHHRISAARERGQQYIDAYVTEIDVPEDEIQALGIICV